MKKTLLPIAILTIALQLAALGQLPQTSPFTVKGSRAARATWLVLSGERSFLYRIHNRGPYPIQVFSNTELAKGEDASPIVEIRPDEAVDLLLEGETYTLVSPLGGNASGTYTLVETFDPLPGDKEN